MCTKYDLHFEGKRPIHKTDCVKAIADSNLEIPEDLYDLWTSNQGRFSNRPVTLKTRSTVVVPNRRTMFEWILENMRTQSDPGYSDFLEVLRERVSVYVQGDIHKQARKQSHIELHPPGFEELKKSPCLMYRLPDPYTFQITSKAPTNIQEKESIRLGKPVSVEYRISGLHAQLVVNGGRDRLGRMGALGISHGFSHLCHSKQTSCLYLI